MPRGKGKFVNHKGRSRHFTSPEELEQEKTESSEEESTSDVEEGEAGAAAAGSSSKGSKTRTKAKPKGIAKENSSEEDSEDEESSEEDDRDARKGVASLIEIENPNRAVKKTAQKLNNLSLEGDARKPELSRREREQIEKQKARQRYEKLHAAGKTSEAKADLARLALIRQQRAEAAAKREAEKKSVEDKKGGADGKA